MASEHELAVGLNKGHKVTKLPKKVKGGIQKGQLTKRVKFIRELIKEVVGYAPYEKRAMEFIKIGRDKKCLKFLKSRLGSLKRAKRKRDELTAIVMFMKRHREH